MNKVCQSCGMKMSNCEAFGTNADGTKCEEYCTYCFQNGAFTTNCTMKEAIEKNLEYLEEFNRDSNTKFTKEEARGEMLAYFPTLKRWRNH